MQIRRKIGSLVKSLTESNSPTFPASLAILQATLVGPEGLARAPLYVNQGRIATGPSPGVWQLDLKDHFIFPGLINTHDHLHLNNIPPLAGEVKFANSYAWIAAWQSYLDEPEVAKACAVPKILRLWQGALKNLLAGTTAVVHHDPWEQAFADPNFPVHLLQRYGWCHSLRGAAPDPTCGEPPYGPTVKDSFASTPANYPWFIHLAEGNDAVATGELAQLASLGCLQANTVLIHGVGLTDADIDLIIARGAKVIWCPGSNLAMLGTTLNPRRLFNAGCLALGSDARLSGGRDLLDELRLAAAHSDLTPRELLQLVTTAGSRVMGLLEIGGLKPGQDAEMIIAADEGSDPYSTLIGLRRKNLRAVMRGGLPAIADLDFAEWFRFCGVKALQVELDGRPKLMAAALLGPPGAAALEPGLEIKDINNEI